MANKYLLNLLMLNFCQVFGGYFWGFAFQKVFFLGGGGHSVSDKVFLGSSEIPNSADSCLNVYQVHSLTLGS